MNYVYTTPKIEALRRSQRIFEKQLWVRTADLEKLNEFLQAEHERVEAELRQSETLLRGIIEASPQCVKRLGRDGALVMMNPAGLSMIEADLLDQVLGQSIYSFVVPEHREGFQSLNERVFHGASGMLEFDLIGLKGTRRTLETHAVPLRDTWGNITSALAITCDITQRKRREEDIKTRARQHATITQLGQSALSGKELPALLDEACALIAQTLDVEFCKVLELLPDGQALRLRAGVGWKDGLVGQAIVQAGLQSQAGYTLLFGAPVLVEDLRTETRFSGPPLLHEHGIVSGISTIILGRSKPFGVLGAHTLKRRTFSEDDVNFLTTIANVLSEALERKAVEEDLHESREALRALAARLQAVREEERTQLAREIHDEFSGALTALKMDLSFVSTQISSEQAASIEKIESMNRLIDSTLNSVRNVSAQLRPGVLDDLGLVAAIEWQARDFQKRFGIQCELNLVREEPALGGEQSTAIFRILQETLTNVARHAEATKVWVSLKEQSGNGILEIRDNGRGISQEEISSSKSLGLLGIRERALAFGGEFLISGTREQGTSVTLKMPLKPMK